MDPFTAAQALDSPLLLDAKADYLALRQVLQQAGYTKEGLQKATHVIGLDSSTNLNLLEVEHRLPLAGSLRQLIRLFRLGHTLEKSELEEAFFPLSPAVVQSWGLIVDVGTGFRSPFMLNLHEDLYILGDQPSESPSVNHVIRLNPSAIVTAAITPRQPIKRACDLGTGNGIQALLAARHAERVIATDINARALNVAAVNGRLNHLHNIDFRLGSWFEPVLHEQFDLIVSNPPFVISPKSQFTYRDSGQPGDEICRMVVQDAASRLNVGGFGVLLGNWPFHPKGDWAAEPKKWLHDQQVDVIGLLNTQADPLGYTMHWQGQEHQTVESLANTTSEWLAYFKQRNIQAIATGSLIVRKLHQGKPFFTGYEIPDVQASPAIGQHLLRLFAAHDRVRDIHNAATWLSLRVKPHADLQIEQTIKPIHQSWEIAASQARLTSGLAFSTPLNPITQGLLILAGQEKLSVLEILHEVARSHHVEVEQIQQPCIDALQYWLLHGMIEVI